MYVCLYLCMHGYIPVVLFEPVSSRGLPCWDPIQSRPAVVVARANFATPRKKALHDMTLPSLTYPSLLHSASVRISAGSRHLLAQIIDSLIYGYAEVVESLGLDLNSGPRE